MAVTTGVCICTILLATLFLLFDFHGFLWLALEEMGMENDRKGRQGIFGCVFAVSGEGVFLPHHKDTIYACMLYNSIVYGRY